MPLSLKHIIRSTRKRRTEAREGDRPPSSSCTASAATSRICSALAPQLDPRFTVVSARGPLTRGPGFVCLVSGPVRPGRLQIDAEEAERSRQLLLRFTDELIDEYQLDPAQVYLMGFSQGCIMSLYTALTEPERFAGVVGMSGRLLPEAIPKLASARAAAGFPAPRGPRHRRHDHPHCLRPRHSRPAAQHCQSSSTTGSIRSATG